MERGKEMILLVRGNFPEEEKSMQTTRRIGSELGQKDFHMPDMPAANSCPKATVLYGTLGMMRSPHLVFVVENRADHEEAFLV